MVIGITEDDNPKVVLNQYYRVWLSLNRRVIAGIIDVLPKKLDEILDAFLKEQRADEKMESEWL
jgi:hypothetical protein